jgi:hypothetical protein
MVAKKMPAFSKESSAHDEEWDVSHERHRKRQRKAGAPMILLAVGWSMVMAGIVLVSNRCWKGNESQRTEWSRPVENHLTAEQQEFLREHVPACQFVIGSVLSHATPEEISPFVFNSREAFSDMVRFYGMNPSTQMFEVPLKPQGFSIIQLNGAPAIEARWQAEDGRLIDAVFRQEEEGWRLDWHHFARFSQYPWGLFLAGNGPEEAEFRLLARQRLVRTILDQDDRPLSLVLHAPRFGRPDDPGPPSPVFELDWESEAARILMAGFNQAREGRRPFGSLLPHVESDEEMMRVRVVVRRIEVEDERLFEIVEVRACHWLQFDDPGISPAESEDAELE